MVTSDRQVKPRVALVGPVLPYRGGIAQYTTELHRALQLRCTLHTFSFRRQYPVWLYPGKSDREPGQENFCEPSVEYKLDALNPLTWFDTARTIMAYGCDLAVIQWWTLFWEPGFALIARKLRKHNVPVLFICHNLFDHDSSRIKRAVAMKLLSQAAGYLVHADELTHRLRIQFPGRLILFHPHPTYDRFPEPSLQLPQRGQLELLFFGFIRPYKGLDVLLEALSHLGNKEIHLTVVGEPWCPASELRERVHNSGAPNVELHLEYVDDVTAANYFARADLVVLPYRGATGSGVAAVAYHYDRPILATRVGGFPDVIEQGHTGFLIDPNDSQALAECLGQVDRAGLRRMRTNVHAFKSRFTWASLADVVLDAAAALGQPPPKLMAPKR